MGVGSGGLYGAAHVRTGNLPTGHKEDRPEPPGNPGCTVVLRTPFLLIHSLILSFIPPVQKQPLDRRTGKIRPVPSQHGHKDLTGNGVYAGLVLVLLLGTPRLRHERTPENQRGRGERRAEDKGSRPQRSCSQGWLYEVIPCPSGWVLPEVSPPHSSGLGRPAWERLSQAQMQRVHIPAWFFFSCCVSSSARNVFSCLT